MKPATVIKLVADLLPLMHAAILSTPSPKATSATLRALAAEAQRTAAKLEKLSPGLRTADIQSMQHNPAPSQKRSVS